MSLAIVQKVEGYLVNPELRKRMLALAEQDVRKLERILVVAQKVVARDPKLQECTVESIVQAITDSVEIGLEPSGFNGDAYLIPRKRSFKDAKNVWQWEMEAHLQLSYKGEAVLAGENGWQIHADVIREGDSFVIRRGAKPELIHEYAKFGERGDILYFYAVATQVSTGFVKWECMEKDEVDHIRDTYAGYKGEAPKAGPWVENYPQMGKKTAIHRVKNLLPLSPKQRRAREIDGEFYENDSETVRGRVVTANEPGGARVPPGAAPVTNGGAPTTSAADAAGPGAAPTPPSPSPAPAQSRKSKSKLSGAMEKSEPAVVSACPDCIPGKVTCRKHGTEKSNPDRANPARVDARTPEPDGAPEPEGAHRAGKAGEEPPGPCELTEGCTRPDGHPGASAGRCEKSPEPSAAVPASVAGASPQGGQQQQLEPQPGGEGGSTIKAIVEAATNSGRKPCTETTGCILDEGHPPFCKGRGANVAGGLFQGKA